MFEGIGRDLTHAARALAKARAFSVVCVVSLGVGIAPVIAVPYIMQVVRMPPSVVNTTSLVEVVTKRNGPHELGNNWSYPDFRDVQEAQQVKTGLTLFGWSTAEVHTKTETPTGVNTDPVIAMFVSTNYFSALGVALAMGPGFTAGATEPEVILGHNFWQNRLVSDPDIVGKLLTFDGVPYRVVGLAPDRFDGHLGGMFKQLFMPLERHPQMLTHKDGKVEARLDRSNAWIHLHGRLSPNVTRAQADAAVSAVTSQLAQQYPKTNELVAGAVEPYYPGGVEGHAQELRLQTLGMTLTGIVLLVVCLNISGMMQVRGAMRERELSIRQAVGASRGRLMQYLFCEAVILAAIGGTIAALVIFNAPAWLPHIAKDPIPPVVFEALRVQPMTIAIAVGICLVASLVFGWLPATRFSRPVILSSLKDDAGGGGFRVGRVHRVTAALQVAIAVPLLVTAGISLDRMRSTATSDLGFASELIYAAPLTFEAAETTESKLRAVSQSLARADGVASVTVAGGLPLDSRDRVMPVALQAAPNAAPRFTRAAVTRVGDGYLDTMGIPLLRGRAFTAADRAGGEKVVIIAKALAGTLFPNADPADALGRALTFGADEKTQQTLTIVGVAGDFPTSGMNSDRAQLLVPLAQQPATEVFLIARSLPGEPANKLTAALENAVREIGPDATQEVKYGDDGAVYSKVVTGVSLRKNSMNDFLTQSMVSGGVGSVILMLAALGVYGVVGLTVATRTREIAIRAALGATRRRLLGMILFDVVKLALPGVVVGMILTVAFMRINSENMGIPLSQVESLAYVVGAAIAVGVAVLASLGPARRASSVQPMVAMRSL